MGGPSKKKIAAAGAAGLVRVAHAVPVGDLAHEHDVWQLDDAAAATSERRAPPARSGPQRTEAR
jgi:hypothetical protein